MTVQRHTLRIGQTAYKKIDLFFLHMQELEQIKIENLYLLCADLKKSAPHIFYKANLLRR